MSAMSPLPATHDNGAVLEIRHTTRGNVFRSYTIEKKNSVLEVKLEYFPLRVAPGDNSLFQPCALQSQNSNHKIQRKDADGGGEGTTGGIECNCADR